MCPERGSEEWGRVGRTHMCMCPAACCPLWIAPSDMSLAGCHAIPLWMTPGDMPMPQQGHYEITMGSLLPSLSLAMVGQD